MADRVALVTGASRGIGLAIAQRLVRYIKHAFWAGRAIAGHQGAYAVDYRVGGLGRQLL